MYYEKYGWGDRVAYTYRSDYLDSISSRDQSNYVYPIHSIDASLSKKITSNFEVILTGTNLNGSNQIHYVGSGRLFQGYFERPTTYSLAVRASF